MGVEVGATVDVALGMAVAEGIGVAVVATIGDVEIKLAVFEDVFDVLMESAVHPDKAPEMIEKRNTGCNIYGT